MKRNLSFTFRTSAICGAAVLFPGFFGSAFAQGLPDQKPPTNQKPPTRKPLPKPTGGNRGFDQFTRRDASARLIAAAGTRVIVDPGDFYSKGEANYKAGNYEAAVKDLKEAVKLSPDWDDPHYVLAISLIELGRLTEAIDEFKQVVKLAIKDEPKVLAYYNMGNAYADMRMYEEAIESYQQAIELNAKTSPPRPLSKPHNNLGLAYAASNRLADAAAEFKEAVTLRPDYAEAHYNLGVAYLQLGKRSDAIEQRRILTNLKSEFATRLDALIKKKP